MNNQNITALSQTATAQKLARSTEQQVNELIKLLFATNLATDVITSRQIYWNKVADITGDEQYRYYARYGNKIDKWTNNSGYDIRDNGTMASVRALEAERKGTFSMGNFIKIYGVSRQHFDFLKVLGLVQNTEWHHTGKSFKETEFFSWKDSEKAGGIVSYEFDGINITSDEDNLQEELQKTEGLSLATLYAQNKKDLTKITKEFKNLNWEYKLPKTEINVITFDDYAYREGKNKVSLTQKEQNQKRERHAYISEFLADNGMPAWERRLEHEQVDEEFKNILNKRIEEYINQNNEQLLEKYNEIYGEDLKTKADIERYNAEIDSFNLSTNGKEKIVLDFAQKFGVPTDIAYKYVRRYSHNVQLEEQRKAEKQEKDEHNKKVKKSIEEEEKALAIWLETLIAGGYVERFSRRQSKPSDFSIITYREMYGRYGWFNSESKSYNLPEYYSGFTFNNENHYNQYQEKKQAIRELSNNIRFQDIWHGNNHNFDFDEKELNMEKYIHYLRYSSNNTIYGFVDNDRKVYLNRDVINLNTPIHEFAHLWVSHIQKHFPDLWNKGKELFSQSEYLKEVQTDPNYQHLTVEEQIDEAMARAIGDNGEKELKTSLFKGISKWISDVWKKIGATFGIENLSSEQISNLSLRDFTNIATTELLSGKDLTTRVKHGYGVNGHLYSKATYKDNNIKDTELIDERFRIGNKRKEFMRNTMLDKLTNATEASIDKTIEEIEKLSEEVKQGGDPKTEKATFHWIMKGTVILPEDNYKIKHALKIADMAKIDPMGYDSPMELINVNADIEIKQERINPDDVATLSNKVEYGYGITVYDVEESDKSRKNMREIINTHFGKNSSPWCLLQSDGNGNLTEESEHYWNEYDGIDKRVAFKDGKLLAFCANDSDDVVWWDRNDRATNGIPVTMKMANDELDRTATYELDEVNREFGPPTDIHKGNKKNGLYEQWYDDRQISVRTTYKDGKKNGLYEEWYENGQISIRATYKDGKLDGLCEIWYKNGQLANKRTHKDGELNGLYEEWCENGQISVRETYKDGKKNGLFEKWHENGQIYVQKTYKDNKLDGLLEEWYENGQIHVQETYKDDKRDGLFKKWHENGQIHVQKTYKDGKLDGLCEIWYKNGQISVRETYKDDKRDGLCEMWYENGQLHFMETYKKGKQVKNTKQRIGVRFHIGSKRKEFIHNTTIKNTEFVSKEKIVLLQKEKTNSSIEELNQRTQQYYQERNINSNTPLHKNDILAFLQQTGREGKSKLIEIVRDITGKDFEIKGAFVDNIVNLFKNNASEMRFKACLKEYIVEQNQNIGLSRSI